MGTLEGNSGINKWMRFILGGTFRCFLYPLVSHLLQLWKNRFIVDVNCTVWGHSWFAYITEQHSSIELQYIQEKLHLHFHYLCYCFFLFFPGYLWFIRLVYCFVLLFFFSLQRMTSDLLYIKKALQFCVCSQLCVCMQFPLTQLLLSCLAGNLLHIRNTTSLYSIFTAFVGVINGSLLS